MWNWTWNRLGNGSLLAVAALFATPALAPAQLREVRAVDPPSFTSYPPSVYSGYATVGPPSYLTSINYPTVYGRWTVGTSWPGPYMSSVLTTPYTLYPTSTYSPVNPPAAAGFSQLFYGTGPGGSPVPARAPGAELSTVAPVDISMLRSASPATIDITLPVDAVVTVQGKKLDASGSTRRFTTPFLPPGAVYSYDISASWYEGGEKVTKTERVLVRPGEAQAVTFSEGLSPLPPPVLKTKQVPR
jgi:uncharacterized protein (TIGR03000 family)